MAADVLIASSLLPADPRRLLPGPRATWTLVGALAIPLWATTPALAKATQALPTFQLMAMIYAMAALLLWSGARLERGGGAGVRAGWLATAVTVVGALGSTAALVLAVRFMPPAPAQLVAYSWPVMVILMAGTLGLARVGRWQVAGVALGLGEAALVIGGGPVALSPVGVGFACLSALAWSVFCVFRLWEGESARDALTPGFAASAVLALSLHLAFEDSVRPDAPTLAAAVIAGVFPLALANLAWDHGVRRGDARLLSVMAFATPLFGTGLLVALGWAKPTAGLIVGGLAIVAGGIASTRS